MSVLTDNVSLRYAFAAAQTIARDAVTIQRKTYLADAARAELARRRVG
jgi:hypothetical protein